LSREREERGDAGGFGIVHGLLGFWSTKNHLLKDDYVRVDAIETNTRYWNMKVRFVSH